LSSSWLIFLQNIGYLQALLKLLDIHLEKEDDIRARLRDVQDLHLDVLHKDQRLCLMHILMIQYFLEMLYVLDNIDEFLLFSGPLVIDANDFLVLAVLLLIASLLDFELVIDLLDSPQALHFLFGVWEEQLNLIPGINEEILINFILFDLIIIVVDLGFLWNDAATVPNLLEDVCVLPWVLFNYWVDFRPSLSFSILLLYVNLNQDEHVRDQEVNGLAGALQLIRSDSVVQELHLPIEICALLLVRQL